MTRLADTLEPAPVRWPLVKGGLLVEVLVLFVAFLALTLPGCGDPVPARTWPEVIDRHWFVTGCLVAWTVFWLALVVGGITVKVKKPADRAS